MATLTSKNGYMTLELEDAEAVQITLKGNNSSFEVGIVELPSSRRILRIYLQADSVYSRDNTPTAINICPRALLEDKEALL